ncbi:MAG: NADH-quinone oxidoreductase subunit N [Pirellulales bacterium]|nr:NADH-quinone oxidoreductase subunit N [Pirellulales bacterium]
MSVESLDYLLPEVLLILIATAIYVAGAFVAARALWGWIAAAALVVAGALVWRGGELVGTPGPLAVDALTQYVRGLAIVVGLLLLLLSARSAAAGQVSEQVGSLLLAITGLMLAAGANDLVLLFVSLELISIPTYVLLYLGGRGQKSQEAAAKYFFLSVLSSAVLLYGFSFLYGLGGSTSLTVIRQAIATGGSTALVSGLGPVAAVLIFAGLAYKIAAVPFHFYAPDVYQGTSHANAALLSVLPKAAGLIVLVRLLGLSMPGQHVTAWRVAMVLAALTMTLGNVLALWQTNVRRLLAYSSIAHSGYMLMGVAAGLAVLPAAQNAESDGYFGMLFYLTVYMLATAGTFAVFEYLGRRDEPLERVDELAGVARSQPVVGIALAAFMFSLAGIPPLAGFAGKLWLFYGALSVAGAPGDRSVKTWFALLAVLGVLNAAVAAAYYLRLIGVSWFGASTERPRADGGRAPWAAALVCAVLVIAIGVYPFPLMRRASLAVQGARAAASEPAPAAPTAPALSAASSSSTAIEPKSKSPSGPAG